MCDSEKKLVADLKEGGQEILFTLSLARSEIRTVRKTLANVMGRPEPAKEGLGVFEQFRLAANS